MFIIPSIPIASVILPSLLIPWLMEFYSGCRLVLAQVQKREDNQKMNLEASRPLP